MNEKAMEGLKKYRDAVKSGEIVPEKLSPLQRAERNPTSLKMAIIAKCYECSGEYADGRKDCGIKSCPLYRWMPYGELVMAKRGAAKGRR